MRLAMAVKRRSERTGFEATIGSTVTISQSFARHHGFPGLVGGFSSRGRWLYSRTTLGRCRCLGFGRFGSGFSRGVGGRSRNGVRSNLLLLKTFDESHTTLQAVAVGQFRSKIHAAHADQGISFAEGI